MSRFSGWTTKAIEQLTTIGEFQTEQPQISTNKPREGKSTGLHEKTPQNARKGQNKPNPVELISSALNILGVEHVKEYKFLHDRRFRFDIAIPAHKIALEFEGGVFTGGRHTRGKGYVNDAKKYNLAVMHGWRLLRYTTADTARTNWEFEIADEIKTFISKTE